MKICSSTYSFGSYRREGIDFMIAKTAEMGFDGIEITVGSFEGSDDPAVARNVADACRAAGLAVASVCTGADFLKGDPDGTVETLCRMVDLTAAYGAGLMRHDVSGGFRDRKVNRSYDDALPILADGCRRVTEYARSRGIVTCTENHGQFSQDSDRVEKLINAVGDENFAALVDIGNFLCADEEPTRAVGVMAGYARHVHAKDFYVKPGTGIDPGRGWFRSRAGNYLKGTIIGHGNAHAAQSLGILRRAGYDGWITVEFEGMEDNLVGLSCGLENVRRFWML